MHWVYYLISYFKHFGHSFQVILLITTFLLYYKIYQKSKFFTKIYIRKFNNFLSQKSFYTQKKLSKVSSFK